MTDDTGMGDPIQSIMSDFHLGRHKLGHKVNIEYSISRQGSPD